jgi:hypothetical protein
MARPTTNLPTIAAVAWVDQQRRNWHTVDNATDDHAGPNAFDMFQAAANSTIVNLGVAHFICPRKT